MDKNFSSLEVQAGYELFAESLENLNADGVEIIPQTMAPYPMAFWWPTISKSVCSSQKK